MPGQAVLLSAGSPPCRLGRLVAAGHRQRLRPYVPKPSRTMPDWVLCLVSQGRGTYVPAGEAPQQVVAPAAMVIPPGTAHWYGTAAQSAWTETWAVFSGPVFDPLAVTGAIAVRPVAGSAASGLRELLQCSVPGPAAAERQLVRLLDWLITELPIADPALPTPIQTAVAILGGDLRATVDMPDVAARVGLGYDSFRRRFRAELGISPLAFRTRRRLEAAANLLRATDMTTRAVAHAVGFTDEFHLSHRFTRHYGITPSAYRRDR